MVKPVLQVPLSYVTIARAISAVRDRGEQRHVSHCPVNKDLEVLIILPLCPGPGPSLIVVAAKLMFHTNHWPDLDMEILDRTTEPLTVQHQRALCLVVASQRGVKGEERSNGEERGQELQ